MSARDPHFALEPGVLRFLTAGSVDDGKSTLIGRLLYDTKAILADQLAAVARISLQRGGPLDLSLLTDGLTAEREQGITIDVAYRYFATAGRKFIIADAPGHEQYTRNMVTAASTAQLAILLVDVRHGVVTQTKRHATLAHLLGIRQVVVAINKMDLVDFREADYVRHVVAFRDFAARTGIDDATLRFLPLSARDGDMVVERGKRLDWYSGPTLLQVLTSAPIAGMAGDLGLRLPVQYVARPEGGHGRRYLGRVESGTLAAGDAVTVLPSGRRTRVREVRRHQVAIPRAVPQDSVAVTLTDEIDVSRGDMLVGTASAPQLRRSVDATLCWFDECPLDLRRSYLLRHTTREVRARIETLGALWNVNTQQQDPPPTRLAMNDIGEARLAVAQPIFADRHVDNHATGSFILIDEVTNATVAAGLIR